jgi:ATP-dependent RNA helicase DDX21
VGTSKQKLAEGITNVAVTATARQRSTMLADLITLYRSQHAIVFVNTKREADDLVAELGIIMKGTEALHGDVPQTLREKILNGFRSGRIPVLVATDVAARGLDIDHVDLVVHHGVPTSVENFIHRSGRTGRAGRKGTSLVLYDKNEQWALNRIQKDAGITFEKRGAPQPDEVMEASAFRAASNLKFVNPELEPYFLPMAEKLMKEEGGARTLAQALAWMSGYKAPPSKRSLQTGEDELRTVMLKPADTSQGGVQVRDVMRIVSGCLSMADPSVLSSADTRIGRISRCMDGSAVIDISPKGAEFLTATLQKYEGSRFFSDRKHIYKYN